MEGVATLRVWEAAMGVASPLTSAQPPHVPLPSPAEADRQAGSFPGNEGWSPEPSPPIGRGGCLEEGRREAYV